MRILQTSDVVHAGGAETFLLRLSNALQEQGHDVFVYVLYKNRIDYKLVEALSPRITVYPARLRAIRLLQLMDGLLLKLRIDFSVINFFLIRDLRSFIRRHSVEVIHSHLFTADYVAVRAAEDQAVPVVTTMHGDYMLYEKKLAQGVRIRMLRYREKLARLLSQLKEIACISEEQLEFFAARKAQTGPLPIHKIYNGYHLETPQTDVSKSSLNIPPEALVYGMVARGIPEKGWEVAIQAFLGMDGPEAYLLLIGDSPYVQGLKQQYRAHDRIIFAGYSANPIEYIRLFSIGLFASTYYAESLPTVLMEYLACGVPAVCCDIAECARMLEAGTEKAGLLVPRRPDGSVAPEDFGSAMKQLSNDSALYNRLREATAGAYKKFDMADCVSKYEQLYARHLSKG